jgi:hypothetical protein
MDNPADSLDQADEEILTYTASDEELDAVAGTELGRSLTWPSTVRMMGNCW